MTYLAKIGSFRGFFLFTRHFSLVLDSLNDEAPFVYSLFTPTRVAQGRNMDNFADDAAGPQVTDAELLRRLRSGDTEAYTELWLRHVQAALRVGRRIVQGNAEDLVSESFLAVFDQVVNSGNGPETSFRAYLFTTMRNTAMRWQRQGRLVDTDPELDEAIFKDGLSWVSDRESSAELLKAFQSLPHRWQRVLWLAEVEDVGREQIAADLGLKPNAVSALLKRAKAGFRLSWLQRAVPEELRNDSAHVARLLPELLIAGKPDSLNAGAQRHLAECGRCAEVNIELRALHQRMRRTTLGTSGLAALGVVFPTVSHAPVTAAAVAALASATAIAAGVTLAIATGATIAELPASSVEQIVAAPETSVVVPHDIGPAVALPQPAQLSTPMPSVLPTQLPAAPVPVTIPTGRLIADDAIEMFDVGRDAAPNDFRETAPRLPVVPEGSVPPPASNPIDPGTPDTPENPEDPVAPGTPPLAVGLRSEVNTSGYFAPVLHGQTQPGASVAVALVRQPDAFWNLPVNEQYVVEADDSGSWALDLRPNLYDRPGTFDYQTWAFADDAVSLAEHGQFVISRPILSGFESLDPFEPLPLDEAQTTGIVFRSEGPVGGQICVSELTTGHAAQFALDESGSMLQRLRLLDPGTYWLSFRACDGPYIGPAENVFVDVSGVEFGPFGPGFGEPFGGELRFELLTP